MSYLKNENEIFENDDFMENYIKNKFKKQIELTEYQNENELIEMTQKKTMIIHFYSEKFNKCKNLNYVLKIISPRFPSIYFSCINVKSCPKMVECLKFDVLPLLCFFKDGFLVESVIGFEKLGNKEKVEPVDLENYIKSSFLVKNTNKDLIK